MGSPTETTPSLPPPAERKKTLTTETQILPDDRVEQFREDGFTFIEKLFEERELAAMRAELARFFEEGLIRNVATEGDGKTPSDAQFNLQICPISPQSDFYRSLQFHPKVVAAVGQLIGQPFVFYLDQIFFKPARIGLGTNWHQDNAYFKVSDPTKGTAMWIALHDATLENGTLHVIPSSHRESYDHGRDPGSNHHIHCQVPEERAMPIELKAGGAAFFNFGIAHCTKANNTDGDHAGLALHFLRADFVPPDNHWKPVHLVGPEETGGEREYGKRVEGTWDAQVDRMLSASGRQPARGKGVPATPTTAVTDGGI